MRFWGLLAWVLGSSGRQEAEHTLWGLWPSKHPSPWTFLPPKTAGAHSTLTHTELPQGTPDPPSAPCPLNKYSLSADHMPDTVLITGMTNCTHAISAFMELTITPSPDGKGGPSAGPGCTQTNSLGRREKHVRSRFTRGAVALCLGPTLPGARPLSVSAAGSSQSRAKTWVWLLPILQQSGWSSGMTEQSSSHSDAFFPLRSRL